MAERRPPSPFWNVAAALICGALAFLIAIAILSLDFFAGTPFVGAALCVYLIAVRGRMHERPVAVPGHDAPPEIPEHGS